MEYMKHGDLNSLILKDYLTEIHAKTITIQVLEGLKIMHENGFCHRDLKPQVRCLPSGSSLHKAKRRKRRTFSWSHYLL